MPPAAAPRGGRSLLGHTLDAVAPGSADLPVRQRWKPVTVVTVLGALVLVLGLVVGFAFDIITVDRRVADEQRANQEYDQSRLPFRTSTAYDRSPGEWWRIVLDRPLTEPEQAALTSIPPDEGYSDGVWRLLEPLGARVVHYPSTLNTSPPGLKPDRWDMDAAVFNLNIISERDRQLSIVDMHAVSVSCRPSTARMVIDYGPQGGAAYEGVLFDLTRNDPVPYITDEDEDEEKEQGRPYFSRRKIDLGGGESPGGLRVEALVSGETCEWEIEATYHDGSPQGGGRLIIKDGDRPFVAEARPRRPDQYWVVSPGAAQQLVPCHTRPAVPECQR